MKSYLMSIPDSIKGVSDKLNVKHVLCNKSWILYHEEDKVVYIFQKDGVLIVSRNGVASKNKWEYIKANRSILIEDNDKMLLLHPTFVDDVLFVLQQDGTDGYVVLIDEKKIGEFVFNTITNINHYLRGVSGEGKEKELKEKQEKIERERKNRDRARELAKNEIKQATFDINRKLKDNMLILIILLVCVFLSLFVTINFNIVFGGILFFICFVFTCFTAIKRDALEDAADKIEKEIIDKYLKQIDSSQYIDE